jgi:c-di-GMP-related signal transduction protein
LRYEQFDRCKAAGIGYSQGYFFCQPKTVAGKGPTSRCRGGSVVPD